MEFWNGDAVELVVHRGQEDLIGVRVVSPAHIITDGWPRGKGGRRQGCSVKQLFAVTQTVAWRPSRRRNVFEI